MSYILEALRKSERERSRDNVPKLETGHRQDGGGVTWLKPFMVLMALILLAASGWWIGGMYLQDTGKVSSSVPAAAESGGDAGTDATEQETRSRGAAGITPADETPKEAAAGIVIRESNTAVAPPSVAAAGGEPDPAVQAFIDDLSVNVVSWSEQPERRFIMLNQRIVRESEAIGRGVVVKRITPEGAVLSIGDREITIRPD